MRAFSNARLHELCSSTSRAHRNSTIRYTCGGTTTTHEVLSSDIAYVQDVRNWTTSATISKGFVCGMLDICILPSLHTRSQYCSMCEPTRFIIAIARIDRALITHMHARIHEPTSNEIGLKKYALSAASDDHLRCFGTANKYDWGPKAHSPKKEFKTSRKYINFGALYIYVEIRTFF